MAEKTVTFVVPSYNSAKTLRYCLDSFLVAEVFEDMEVLVVSDGSTDTTAAIAKEYAKQYPFIKLYEKENGGHGSVINFAAKIAQGRYLKVIDSDDKVQNLAAYVHCLKKTTSDIDVVFTNFRTIDIRSGNARTYATSNIPFGEVMLFEEFWKHKQTVTDVCCFHGITYGTSFYNLCNITLSEGISYEDQEYATLPFVHVKTVLPLDLFLYDYTLGSADQSVSDDNQVKNFDQMLHVLWQLINSEPKNANATVKSYFRFKQSRKLLSCYTAALIKNKNKKDGRRKAKELRSALKQRNIFLFNSTRRAFYTCLLASFFGINGNNLFKHQNSKIYRMLLKHIRR